jgi:hypothetical protein
MVTAGLYRHYKNQKLYRVLFAAEWDVRDFPDEDAVLAVYVEAHDDKSVSVRVRPREKGNPGFYGSAGLFDARWSGNSTTVYIGEPIVIYVALYGDGRVAARPLREFEERVNVPCSEFRGQRHDVARFERIGD